MKFNKNQTKAAERRMLAACIENKTALPEGYEYVTFGDGSHAIARIETPKMSRVVCELD